MGEQFQLEGERLVPEENHRRNRPESKENRTHAEHGRRHVAVVLHRDAVREIARQDNRKARGEQLREDEGVDHRPEEHRRFIIACAVRDEEQLHHEHHAREEDERPRRHNGGVRVRLEMSCRRPRTEQPLQLKPDARHGIPPPLPHDRQSDTMK